MLYFVLFDLMATVFFGGFMPCITYYTIQKTLIIVLGRDNQNKIRFFSVGCVIAISLILLKMNIAAAVGAIDSLEQDFYYVFYTTKCFAFGCIHPAEAKFLTVDKAWRILQEKIASSDKVYREKLEVAVAGISSSDESGFSSEQRQELEQVHIYLDAWKQGSVGGWQRIIDRKYDEPLAHMARLELDRLNAIAEEQAYELAVGCIQSCGGQGCVSNFMTMFPFSAHKNDLGRIMPGPTCGLAQILGERHQALELAKLAAAEWLSRNTPSYKDFIEALNAVRDMANLTGAELIARTTLLNAENIVKFRDVGWNADSKRRIPVKIILPGTDDLTGRAAIFLYKKLKNSRFNLVDAYTDAALYVEIHHANNNAPEQIENGLYISTSAFCVKATWIGGTILFNSLVSEQRKASGNSYDITLANGAKAQIDSFEAAIADAASLFNNTLSSQCDDD